MGALKKGLGGGTGLSGIEEDVTNDLLFTGTNKLYFRDSGLYMYSSADGKITIVADGSSTDDITLSGTVTFDAALDVNAAIDLDGTTTNTTAIVDIAQAGTGKGLRIDQNATAASGIALELDDESTGNTTAVQIASVRTGAIVSIEAAGDCTKALAVSIADGGTQTALDIDHNETNGNAVGIKIDVLSNGTSAFAFDLVGVATNAGIVQTNGVSTNGFINDGVAAIRVQYKSGAGGAATGYIPIVSTFA